MTFFWSSLHFGQDIGLLGSDDLFFGLHFIALHCSRQKFGQPREGGVKFAKSPPQSRKMAKNNQFCRIIPPNAQHRFAFLVEWKSKECFLVELVKRYSNVSDLVLFLNYSTYSIFAWNRLAFFFHGRCEGPRAVGCTGAALPR